tara:strand:+ start:885 stop:1232 length:348 start_codon:yes stop_codon:yes gene_type:complete
LSLDKIRLSVFILLIILLAAFVTQKLIEFDKNNFCYKYAQKWSAFRSERGYFNFNECKRQYPEFKNKLNKWYKGECPNQCKGENSYQIDLYDQEAIKQRELRDKYLEENIENLFR